MARKLPPPSNSELARTLGVCQSTISRLRAGIRRPGLDLLITLRDVYGLTPAQFNRLVTATTAGTREQSATAMRELFSKRPRQVA